MMNNLISRVSVLAAGVSRYKYLTSLKGAVNDVASLREILIDDETTAIYKESQFISIENPSSSALRLSVTDWVFSIGALHEIIVFYFSGHAVPLGFNDIGLCTTDTRFQAVSGLPIQTSLVSLREIVSSVVAVKADPVIILDACYSGKAGGTLQIVFEEIRKIVQSEAGSTYALLTSCRSLESSIDDGEHGVFSRLLVDTCRAGIESIREPYLSLSNLHPTIRSKLELLSYEMTPQLFIGDTLPNFPVVQNKAYKEREEKFTHYFMECLRALWNDGNPVVLKTSEIRQNMRAGVYGNNSKLKLEPWGLIEDAGSSRERKLTERGIQFMRGELEIPQRITKIAGTGIWKSVENSKMISIRDFPLQQTLI